MPEVRQSDLRSKAVPTAGNRFAEGRAGDGGPWPWSESSALGGRASGGGGAKADSDRETGTQVSD